MTLYVKKNVMTRMKSRVSSVDVASVEQSVSAVSVSVLSVSADAVASACSASLCSVSAVCVVCVSVLSLLCGVCAEVTLDWALSVQGCLPSSAHATASQAAQSSVCVCVHRGCCCCESTRMSNIPVLI